MRTPKAKCAGCGAEQPHGQIRCDVCGEPLVFPVSFVCPHCEAESFNVNDIVEGYCGRCHRFAADPDPAEQERAEARRDPRQRALFADIPSTVTPLKRKLH